MAINYGIELHHLVYPKWAKIRFKLSDKGKLLFIINPAITPGKLPDGIKPGVVPKGTKIFDYSEDKECIISLSLSECMKLVDFVKTQCLVDTVELKHKLNGELKVLQFKWVPNKSGTEIDFCNIIYNKYNGETSDKSAQNIFVPIPFEGLREIVAVINSYLNNFVTLKTLCLAELIGTVDKKHNKNFKPRSDLKKADELPDWEDTEE